MATKLVMPQHWEDWVNLLLGIWLCASPWALGFAADQAMTQYAFGFGILLIVLELVELVAFRAWEEWINVVLGAVILVSPWVAGGMSMTPMLNFFITGLLVLALALYEIRDLRRHMETTHSG